MIRDHHADVYGLTAHPQRPFVFASSSRDTTLRFWIMDGVATTLKTKAVLGASWSEILGTVESMELIGSPSRLAGVDSLAISKSLRDLPDVERYRKIFDFFSSANGISDLWDLIKVSFTQPIFVLHSCFSYIASFVLFGRHAPQMFPVHQRLVSPMSTMSKQWLWKKLYH